MKQQTSDIEKLHGAFVKEVVALTKQMGIEDYILVLSANESGAIHIHGDLVNLTRTIAGGINTVPAFRAVIETAIENRDKIHSETKKTRI
jgi:hypothetical protein